jgi:predicted TIM-barrel fold metal-dependent hydrolase
MGAELMVRFIKNHGSDKVLFGTDSPWTDMKDEVEAFRRLHLTDDEINAVMGGNAERLLWNHAG